MARKSPIESAKERKAEGESKPAAQKEADLGGAEDKADRKLKLRKGGKK
jgi:hypothetical protein